MLYYGPMAYSRNIKCISECFAVPAVLIYGAATNNYYSHYYYYSQFIVLSIKHQNILNNGRCNLQIPCFFPTNSSKLKDVQFTFIYDKEKQQILIPEAERENLKT